MTTAYTDLGLSAFSFLSIVFFFQAIEKRRLFYYGLSGIFLGFAFSVKVLAAMTLAGILAAGFGWIVLKRSRSDWNHFFAGVSLFLLSLLLACGFWYLRAYLLTGNPFFPYFGQFFGHDLIPMSERDYGTTGMGKDVLSLVLLPWNLVVHPTAFENRTDQIGPLFSLLLPFLLWGAWKVREARFYAGVGLAQVASWFFLAQVSRFLYPALPVLFSAEILGFQNFEKRFPRWGVFAKSLFGILFLALLALSCYRYRYPLRLATGEWTARQFLENLERTTGIADYVNSQLPPTGVKILMAGEVRRYYFDRTIVRERAFGRHTKYSKVFKSPAEVVEFLKRQGITHVLWSDPAGEERKYPKLHIKTLVRDPVISPQFFELMHETKSRNIRDLVYDYALYRIKNTG
jgi:MFS family permease